MKRFINWINMRPPSTRQWLWFGLLWCFGLFTVLLITAPVKFLIWLTK